MKKRYLAMLAAVLVTIMWASSYIINQFALTAGVGSFTLAGLRYLVAGLGALALSKLPGRRRGEGGSVVNAKPQRLKLKQYIILGMTGFFLTAGFQYFGQTYLEPTQTTLLINVCNAVAIVAVDMLWLKEMRGLQPYVKVLIGIAGVLIFYYPWHFASISIQGVACMMIAAVGYAIYTAYSRKLMANPQLRARDMLHIPMLVGAVAMLAVAAVKEGMPTLNGAAVLIILWLGLVNGTLAYVLWAWTQRYLQMYESSVINNLVLIEVVMMDVIIFGRSLSPVQAAGIALVAASVFICQKKPSAAHGQAR